MTCSLRCFAGRSSFAIEPGSEGRRRYRRWTARLFQRPRTLPHPAHSARGRPAAAVRRTDRGASPTGGGEISAARRFAAEPRRRAAASTKATSLARRCFRPSATRRKRSGLARVQSFGFVERSEALSLRVEFKTEGMGKEAVLILRLPDIEDSHLGLVFRKHRLESLTDAGLERGKRTVEHDPARPVEENAGEGQTVLFAIVQPAVPSLFLVELRLEIGEANCFKGLGNAGPIVGIGRVRVGEGLSQCARRRVARSRHEDDRFTRRPRDAARAPRPEPGDRPEK